MKVALIHDYLVQYGGAEKTLEAIAEIYPEADIYTGIYDPKNFPETITSKNIITPKNFFFRTFPKYTSFLMPLVFESFDLREYDLIISDSACWAKGVLTNPNQLHISYIHTPPRFLYGYSVESQKRNAWYFKPVITVLDTLLRGWDFGAAQRPDYLLCNSIAVQERINKFYKRTAKVINPPVEVKCSGTIDKPKDLGIKRPFLLGLGRLAAYKNFENLVKAINLTDYNLVLAGGGAEEKKLRQLVKELGNENIIITGFISEPEKHWLLSNCRGLINSVDEEDFGIVPLEASIYGKPVLGHKSGGHLETIVDGVTGMFFEDLNPEKLAESIKEFVSSIEENKFDEKEIKKHASKFSKSRFKQEFKSFIDSKQNA